MSDKSKMHICKTCQPQSPIIWTMAFNGAEKWCPRCNGKWGMFEGGSVRVEPSDKLMEFHKRLKEMSEKYLSAYGFIRSGGGVEIGGRVIRASDLKPEALSQITQNIGDCEVTVSNIDWLHDEVFGKEQPNDQR